MEQGWLLSRAWYRDRLSPEWKRKTAEEFEEIVGGLGLSGPFWRM